MERCCSLLRRARPLEIALLLTPLLVGLFAAQPGGAEPAIGFIENFTSDMGDFLGGTARDNPGTGGVDGTGDGYLRITNPFPSNFGTRSSASDYAGNYRTAGVTHIRIWLNDVEGDQGFEIHFGIGRNLVPVNFWQYDVGFTPAEGAWSAFVVDLADSTRFTQVQGSGPFAQAVQSATNILIRHDMAPFFQFPDQIAGEVGIDKIEFLGSIPVHPNTWGRIKTLFR
jgi:hypothetical protein